MSDSKDNSITAEHVAEALALAQDGGYEDDHGAGHLMQARKWSQHVPDYVQRAWLDRGLDSYITALTRWHAELVAAETSEAPAPDAALAALDAIAAEFGWEVHTALGDDQFCTQGHTAYEEIPSRWTSTLGGDGYEMCCIACLPVAVSYAVTMNDMGAEAAGHPIARRAPVAAERAHGTAERVRMWGDAIEDGDEHVVPVCVLMAASGPDPIDDTAPERLRERREALGLSDQWARDVLGPAIRDVGLSNATKCLGSKDDRLLVAEGGQLQPDKLPYSSAQVAALRQVYAAALSAAEAERAAKPDHLAYADSPVWDDGPLPTPTPERPAPRFKVGDWVRVVTDPNSAGRINPIRVTCVTSAGYIMADGASWAAEHLTPALDPALHETARKTVAWLRGGARGTGPADFTTLPGWSDWNSGSRWDAAEHWAAQLERLLGDAP